MGATTMLSKPGEGLSLLSSDQRCLRFRQLLEEVIFPQRQRLLQYRDHTWQSAHVDSDGSLGELIAAYVTGVPGRTLKGKSGEDNDLSDGTEVKSSYRLDPNIDFVLEGTLTTVTLSSGRAQRVITLSSTPEELQREEILAQINSNASSVQLLASNDSETHALGADLARTISKQALADGALRLTAQANFAHVPDNTPVVACVRQERGHINFGGKTRSQFESMFSQQAPILVFYTFDPLGRPSISVVRVGLTPSQRAEYLSAVFGNSQSRIQIQPYLFPDNIRNRLYDSERHSVTRALKGRLLCTAVATSTGVDILHWDPDDPPLVEERMSMLTREVPRSPGASFSHSPISLNLDTEAGRQSGTSRFYDECVKGWFESLRDFCVEANVTTNIGLGNLSQHLVSLRTGIRGSRSGARGADLVESDGKVSEIKLATGDPTELQFMDSSDIPRLNLQSNRVKLSSWKRLFPVRIVALEDGINVLVHAPTRDTMAQFRQQVEAYFEAHPSSVNVQYHAYSPLSDCYGPEDRRLCFERVGWLKPSGDHEFRDVPAFET